MDERSLFALVERYQRMLEYLEWAEENIDSKIEPVVTVDNQGRHVFKDSDEMASYYARRMHE